MCHSFWRCCHSCGLEKHLFDSRALRQDLWKATKRSNGWHSWILNIWLNNSDNSYIEEALISHNQHLWEHFPFPTTRAETQAVRVRENPLSARVLIIGPLIESEDDLLVILCGSGITSFSRSTFVEFFLFFSFIHNREQRLCDPLSGWDVITQITKNSMQSNCV